MEKYGNFVVFPGGYGRIGGNTAEAAMAVLGSIGFDYYWKTLLGHQMNW